MYVTVRAPVGACGRGRKAEEEDEEEDEEEEEEEEGGRTTVPATGGRLVRGTVVTDGRINHHNVVRFGPFVEAGMVDRLVVEPVRPAASMVPVGSRLGVRVGVGQRHGQRCRTGPACRRRIRSA